MGLDLTIRVQSDFRTDELGRDIWTVTRIANLRGCHNILEQLSNRLQDIVHDLDIDIEYV